MTAPGWLTGLERRLGLNLRHFAHSGSWVTGRYVALGILSLATSIAFARLATKDVYGQYQLAFSIVSLASLLSIPGLNTVALKAVAEGRPGVVVSAARASFRASFLTAAASALAGAGFLWIRHEPVLGWSLLAAAPLLPFLYGPNTWYVLYEGRLDFRSPTLRIVAMTGLTAAWLVGGLWLRLPLPWLFAGYLLLGAICTSLFYLESARQIGPVGGAAPDIRAGIWYSVQKFTAGIQDTVQPLIIAGMFGYASLGVFTIGYTLVNSAGGLVSALSATYFPLLVRYKTVAHGRIVVQHLLLGAALAAAYTVGVTLAFPLLYGAANTESRTIALGIAGSLVLVPLRTYLTAYLTATAHPSAVTLGNVGAFVVATAGFVMLRHHEQLALISYSYLLQAAAVVLLGGAYARSLRHT